MNTATRKTWSQRIEPLVRGFHAYATWLVGISWKRFFVLSILLLILANILQSMPPFSWTMREVIQEHEAPKASKAPEPPKPPPAPKSPPGPSGERAPVIIIEKSSGRGSGEAASEGAGRSGGKGIDITIDERGLRVITRPTPAAPSAPAAPAASGPNTPAASAPATPAASAPGAVPPREIRVEVHRDGHGQDQASIRVTLPEGVEAQDVREAIEEAKQAVIEALREPAIETVEGPRSSGPTVRVSRVHMENFLTDLALLWIMASIIIKLTYKGQLQARAQAAQATEMAEAESLKRQLAEARMATMQAQVEPHFLFNTLASIEHLIETDPPRAGRMQRALIELLRATMPTLRDGGAAGPRTLGQEQAVITPYLEILRMRMEDRLDTTVNIPLGLQSAECPPMVLQMLVENAIKHGLEPKPEGGQLLVDAAVFDGQLRLIVEDSGVGLAPEWDRGTGTGLKNIRDRLALRYGDASSLTVEPREGGGTRVTVALPYKVVAAAGARTADDAAQTKDRDAPGTMGERGTMDAQGKADAT